MNTKTVLVFILVFCINPFASVMLLVFLKLIAPSKDHISDFVVFAFMTLYACLLQSTVHWNPSLPSDWYGGGYWELYKSAKDASFIDYVLKADKEPGWRLLSFVAHMLFQDNYFIFINGVAMATIVLTCTSIYVYWKQTGTDSLTLIASLALFVWFSEYIGALNNITRQLFAVSLMVYAYTKTASKGKICWWALVGACSVHTLMFIFAPFVFAKSLCQALKPKTMIRIALVIAGFSLLITFAPFLARLLDQVSFLSYGLERASRANALIDEWSANPVSVYSTSAIIILISLEVNYIENSCNQTLFFSNLLMILMAMSALTVVMAPALNLRIYISRFYFFPFVLPYFLLKYKLVNRVYATGIILFFGARFFMTFTNLRGGTFFPPFSQLMTYSLMDFIL